VTVFCGFPEFTNILQIAVFLDRDSSRVFSRFTRVAARLLHLHDQQQRSPSAIFQTVSLGTRLNEYKSTRTTGCPPPFDYSMNVNGNFPLIVVREGVPDHVVYILIDVCGELDAPVEQRYPATLSTSGSRSVSLPNLALSTKTATARTASVVSRPTVMFLVNPRTM
jgi:hypothetical protein